MVTQATLKKKPDFEYLADEYNLVYEQISKIEQEFHELFDDKIGGIGCIAYDRRGREIKAPPMSLGRLRRNAPSGAFGAKPKLQKEVPQ